MKKKREDGGRLVAIILFIVLIASVLQATGVIR
jgi:hypothetical protein